MARAASSSTTNQLAPLSLLAALLTVPIFAYRLPLRRHRGMCRGRVFSDLSGPIESDESVPVHALLTPPACDQNFR
nr:hypothetical protein GCM10025730_15840 [Promicromonospora thailandica]